MLNVAFEKVSCSRSSKSTAKHIPIEQEISIGIDWIMSFS